MKKVKLSGSPRENVGKKESVALRNAGNVPAVLYGGEKQVHFSVSRLDVAKVIYTPDVYNVELDINGESYNAIVKDVQFHPVTDAIVHIDFLELIPNKEVKIKLPVKIVGNSIGVRNGGKLMVMFRKLDVRGLPEAIPSEFEVDITKLRIGTSIRVKELSAEGLTFLNNPNAMVVQVRTARGAVDTDDEEDEEGEGEAAATEEKAAE
ncbi:50S ribosomal protein L25/general stress protein Ctc [Luteibaculum oceani]|uniref:Large ribosomal subunit protein bL25 n=1 Tax=Luteibaculum oceani TaxID=1294296 RepID=A0A5C6VL88_9FLAO|nr:50S ribosomal protein L25/general stress protein Ctc [Luteibaculum oceani]TXC85146.1 50S ribosomal protein L25/general stress protein Ctc [Luteibaculum oceani]